MQVHGYTIEANANLEGANLEGANLHGLYLEDCKLNDAIMPNGKKHGLFNKLESYLG